MIGQYLDSGTRPRSRWQRSTIEPCDAVAMAKEFLRQPRIKSSVPFGVNAVFLLKVTRLHASAPYTTGSCFSARHDTEAAYRGFRPVSTGQSGASAGVPTGGVLGTVPTHGTAAAYRQAMRRFGHRNA